MSLFLNNATATRFGASRLCLDLTSAGLYAAAGGFDGATTLTVKVYTCTSSGTLTERGSGSAAYSAGNIAVSVVVASDGTVPTDGGVVVGADIGGGEVPFYSPTGLARVAAGTHSFTISTHDDEGTSYIDYGGGVSYGPDTLVECGPWSYDLLLLSNIQVDCAAGHANAYGTETTATGEGIYGPWSYDLALLATSESTVTASAGVGNAYGCIAVARALETGDDGWSGFAIVGATATSYADSEVRSDTTYQYRISPISATSDPVYSNSVFTWYGTILAAGHANAYGTAVTISASQIPTVTLGAGAAYAYGSLSSVRTSIWVEREGTTAAWLPTVSSTAIWTDFAAASATWTLRTPVAATWSPAADNAQLWAKRY